MEAFILQSEHILQGIWILALLPPLKSWPLAHYAGASSGPARPRVWLVYPPDNNMPLLPCGLREGLGGL